MKLKKFDDYLKKRLDSARIAVIEQQVDMAFELLKNAVKSEKGSDLDHIITHKLPIGGLHSGKKNFFIN